MNQYSFSDELEENKKEENLLDQLKKVDKDYTIQTNPDVTKNDVSLDLKKMTFNPMSSEDVTSKAEEGLNGYKSSTLSSIDEKFDGDLVQIDEKRQKAEDIFANDEMSLQKAYDIGKEKGQVDAIGKGLVRSSIFDNSMQAYDDLKYQKTKEIKTTLQTSIEKLNGEKTLLESQKETAINNFNIAYAVKLNEKIDSINAELLKQEQTVLKYNNSVEEKEKDFQLSQEKANLNELKAVQDNNEFLANYIARNGAVGLSRLKSETKLDVAKEYYSNMSTGDALAHLSLNPEIKTSLGSYYSKLLDYLSSRNG